MNTDSLLERAKWGKLSPEEIDEVAQELDAIPPQNAWPRSAVAYTLIHILGKAQAKSHLKSVEPFLHSDEPSLVKIALMVLCSHWDMTANYLPELASFLKPLSWDPDGDIRITAISVVGEYLSNNSNPDLLSGLWHVYREDEDSSRRQWAYCAIARMAGREHRDIPRPGNFDPKRVDASVIAEAERRLLSGRG